MNLSKPTNVNNLPIGKALQSTLLFSKNLGSSCNEPNNWCNMKSWWMMGMWLSPYLFWRSTILLVKNYVKVIILIWFVRNWLLGKKSSGIVGGCTLDKGLGGIEGMSTIISFGLCKTSTSLFATCKGKF